jgi:hypothetical protein
MTHAVDESQTPGVPNRPTARPAAHELSRTLLNDCVIGVGESGELLSGGYEHAVVALQFASLIDGFTPSTS